jgi:predicted nucleic acid-binding protein
MKGLLDVNALVAFGIREHEFHERVATWFQVLQKEEGFQLFTCSITELGFVRVLAQTPHYGFTVSEARDLLLRMKRRNEQVFSFVDDTHDIAHIPGWVKYPKQLTDGHLVRLAKAHGAELATLDTGIPGAYLIPSQI